ncbi:unnamed protein product [Rotaria sordida]|uniref:Uncharacterized protein n=3 Tax=Rotaria sordida TaxID=392033 RepID=A0A814T467_9BILA|nr:unnamed protein product [Rotaria sordida]
MSRFEEKFYLQNVFDTIDQVYKMKKTQQILSYEERLRNSFNKLLVPDWYNHEYSLTNVLRKTKSHGHVQRIKRTNLNNNDDTPDISISSSINSPHLSNGTYRQSYRHRSPSRSWSEKPPLRRDSTTSSYDTNTSIIHGRRFTTSSSSSSSYAPGQQRVAQSSTWYKPRIFATKITNGHSNEPPKPLPRYSKIDPGHKNSLDSCSLLTKIDNVHHHHHPIKPRTMAQPPVSSDESALDVSSEGDVTIVQNSSIQETNIEESLIDKNETTNIPRTNSTKSLTSEAESYRSAILPSIDKNLLVTDSSSYASVNDRCLSPSTASYHTARAGDTSSSSSITGYETPTPKLDDDDDDDDYHHHHATLSSHSSLSDLSHAETLEPSAEDLDIVLQSIAAEQKSVIIPIVDTEMENPSLPSFTSTSSNTDNLTTIDSNPSENPNWYDGSLETCIYETEPTQIDSSNIREIFNDEILREVDINAVGDEFFLFSPHGTTNNQSINSLNNNNNDKQYEHNENFIQISNRIFTIEDKTLDIHNDFHYSSSNDPFGFDNNNNNNNINNNNTSIMITNLDDILIDDNDNTNNNFLNTINYRRPIQEDILYEVEHENSFSDHSQNTSSIIATNDQTSIKFDVSMDYLTSTDNSIINNISNENEKQISSTNNNVLPIYILPPLYTTSTINEPSLSLHINTNNNNIQKWNSSITQYSDLSSPLVYTPKIRHRQYSVGSYYDNKTTAVNLNPNYFLGSAPVSPLSRTSTTSSESHYHIHQHHSPTSYDNISLNALRHVNPFLESNINSSSLITTNDYRQITDSYSLLDDKTHIITSTSPKITLKSVEKMIPINEIESTSIIPQSIASPSSIRTSSITFSQYEIPITHPKSTHDIPKSSPSAPPPPSRPITFKQEPLIQENPTYESPTSPIRPTIFKQKPSLTHENITYESPLSPIHSSLFEQEPTLVRPKTSRGHIRPSPVIIQRKSIEKEPPVENIYQDIDTTLTNTNQYRTSNADLQFIRDAIERVFKFHNDTTNESNTYYEEVIDNNNLNQTKKTSVQYPAIEAIQRFYNHKILSDIDKQIPNEQITNLDDIIISNSSTSNKSHSNHSPIINQRKKDNISKLKSSEYERASSEEIDDTLNDIEDVDYHDEKLKRHIIINNHSTDTSNESSPLLLSDIKLKTNNISQETQTIERKMNSCQKPSILANEIPSNLSYPTTRSTIPPIEIITEMVIEEDDIVCNNGEIEQISGDMIIFYDDIEIVEHLTSSCSSESDSTTSSCHHYSKPINTNITQSSLPLPPPIPARTLKPIHLLNNNNQQQQQQQQLSSSTVNKIYDLDKSLIRKKIDVNSVNDILNRTDYNMESTVSHRHPSARHFVGKLNNDDISLITTPSQPIIINGHEHKRTTILTKNPCSTLPSRSSLNISKNEKHRSIIADTNALVKQIQNSLSRNSLHDTQINSKNLSSSTKDLRAFVSTTYSPSHDNIIDNNNNNNNNDNVHRRQQINNSNDQTFKRHARLSKSFHNVSEYNSIDQYSNKDNNNNNNNNNNNTTITTIIAQPSKSVENNLNQVSQNQIKQQLHTPLNFTSVVKRTSSSALQNADDNTRMLSMKWYTGQVNENSEISYNTHHIDADDLLYGYILTHSNRETQALFMDLQSSNDPRIHAALDDIRSRVAQFDTSKTRDDLHVFMRYLESRLRDLNHNKNLLNNDIINTHQQSDNISIKNRTNESNKEIPPPSSSSSSSRQFGRQHIRSSNNMGNTTNIHQSISSRRSSQSSANQENSAVFDDMLNTVLGLPKKGVSTLPSKQEKSTPLIQTQMTTNTIALNKTGRDIGKRLFESGTYKDPRLIYDGPRKTEKEEEPLETSISVEDDEKTIFNIDLNKLQIQINGNRQFAYLVKKQFNGKATNEILNN